ncbi:MAG: hypothetical protein AB1758_17445 [Candidatus Eremiobacterota bacterium]
MLAIPAAATPAVRYDLAVQRFLEEQSRAVAECGSVLEDWLYGRISTARAREKLAQRREAVEAWGDKIAAAPVPKGLEGYRQGALARSSSQRKALESIESFVAAGKTDRPAVEGFAADVNGQLSRSTTSWLKLRQSWLGRFSGSPGWYAWQKRVLPLQLRQVELSGRLQQLIYRGASEQADLAALSREATEVVKRVAALRREAAAVPAPAGVQAAQKAFLAELASLEKLAEAVSLMGRDPSEDSSSRLRRFSRQLVEDSRRSQDAALDALEASLQAG